MNLEQILTPVQAPEILSADQRAIWNLLERAKSMLLRKNIDYGSSVLKAPILDPLLPATTAIVVRMSDKITRLQNLLRKPNAALVNERIEDTMLDLGSYAFLYCIALEAQEGSADEKRN